MSKLLFVYLHHAYTSEADLLKHEGAPAEESSLFEYEGKTPAALWRAEGGPGVILITADFDEAISEFQAGATCVFRVSVVGVDTAPAWTKFVLARGPEHVPGYLQA